MLQNTMEGIFTFYYMVSLPVWITIIAGTIVFCVFNRGNRMNGKPNAFNITHNSFEVRWKRPTFAFPCSYIVNVRNVTTHEVWTCRTSGRDCSTRVTNLSLNTNFVARVCACIGPYTWPIGDESDVITTKNLAFKIKSSSTLLQNTQAIPGTLPMYAVRYEVEEIDFKKIRRILIGEAPENGSNQNGKGILTFSTTHSGQTTLLEGIMNFTFGVSSNDDFRLCFESEISDMSKYQDWITVFEFQEFEGGRLDYPLTIIDIPRSHGLVRKHLQSVHEKLNVLWNLYKPKTDLICFVADANTSSLSCDQIEYIQTFKYLFENDSDANMCCIFTSADLGPVHIQNALDENNIAFSESFSVNLSNLFQTLDNSSYNAWVTNYDELKRLLDQLPGSVSKTLRINQNCAPETIMQLTSDIAFLKPAVSKCIADLGDIKYQVKMFTDHKQEIMSKGDFPFTIEEIRQTKTPLPAGHHVTNCMMCFYTCHEKCNYENNSEKMKCIAMHKGYCRKCTGHCIWYVHENTPYIYKYHCEKVTKSYKEMKSTYEAEKGKQLDFDGYLELLNKDIKALLGRLYEKVKSATDKGNELNGIQKSPLAGSVDDTIDNMIASENHHQEIGYQQRIEMFQELKEYTNWIRIEEQQ